MTAYYNEFDPGAAAWLRELIKAGLIADGEVDERSILDVDANDVRGFTQCHWFGGIGGWSYALRLAGWPDDRPAWTGSPPCQPFSAAGEGKGRDDPRHLAPKFISLVGAARPGMLFGEQVASSDVFGKAAKRARGNAVAPPQWAWFDDLSDRLEAARYAVGASDFPSAGIGAPHIRQRTFFGAVDLERLAYAECGAAERHGQPLAAAQGGMQGEARKQRLRPDAGHGIDFGGMADGAGSGWREERADSRGRAVRDSPEGIAAGFGAGGSDLRSRPLHGFWADADWLLCRDGKWRPVEPGSKPLAARVSGRVGLLRGFGNAINPHAAAEFIKAFGESVYGMRIAA